MADYELKYLDTQLIFAPPSGGFILSSINNIPQGPGTSQRVGKKVTIKAIQVQATIIAEGQVALAVGNIFESVDIRAILLLDKQCNGQIPLPVDIMVNPNDVDSFLRMDQENRFDVVNDWVKIFHYPTPSAYSSALITTPHVVAVNLATTNMSDMGPVTATAEFAGLRSTDTWNNVTSAENGILTVAEAYPNLLPPAPFVIGGADAYASNSTYGGFVEVDYDGQVPTTFVGAIDSAGTITGTPGFSVPQFTTTTNPYFYQGAVQKKMWYTIPCEIPIEFSGATGAIGEIRSNNLFFLFIKDTVNSAVQINGYIRIIYAD